MNVNERFFERGRVKIVFSEEAANAVYQKVHKSAAEEVERQF
jgi:hypothetical protein